jgi:hypothetical protein
MNMTKLTGLNLQEESGRLVLSQETNSESLLKAVLFMSLTIVCLFALAGISVFTGSVNGNIVQPRSNHVGFLWAVTSVAMLILMPLYLSRIYRPQPPLEFLERDGTVRRDGSLLTRFDQIEYLELSEARDADGRYLSVLTMLHGDGRELVIHRSYEERDLLALADRLARYTGTTVRTVSSSMLT